MTLQQLKYIIEIVSSGSVNETIKKLYVTQPSLSNAVEELESEMGIELFLRTPKGIMLTSDGAELFGYACQVAEQVSLLEQQYLNRKSSRQLCSISIQRYASAVNVFISMIQRSGADKYESTLRETRIYEVIEDVKTLCSEFGILYRNPFSQKMVDKLFKKNHLESHLLFTAEPCIFISSSNPLAKHKSVTLEDLEEHPYLSFEQGDYNSFYFSEEILSIVFHKKSTYVSDRAAIFNLMIGLDDYTISTGVVSVDLSGDNITSVPLIADNKIQMSRILNRQIRLSKRALSCAEELRGVIGGYGLTLEEQAGAGNSKPRQ